MRTPNYRRISDQSEITYPRVEVIISQSESYGRRLTLHWSARRVRRCGSSCFHCFPVRPLAPTSGVRAKRRALSAQIRKGASGGGGVEGCGSIPEGLTTKTKSPRRRLEAVTRSDVRPSALGWEWECEEARGRIRDGLGVAGAAMAPFATYPRLVVTHCWLERRRGLSKYAMCRMRRASSTC